MRPKSSASTNCMTHTPTIPASSAGIICKWSERAMAAGS
ncbi:hypothetical protein Barb4_03971 [Bacteroidales bacterium Barb4]|nr:hypothetical protein Barb4_03971 [Bacteroidales bacterium Barb4]